MTRIYFVFILSVIFFTRVIFVQGQPMPQMGGDFRPNYESYRIDKFIEQGEASYSGDLNFSIPLLTVPGRHGHNFDIKISYNSNVHQRQFASWVGLGWSLDIGYVERTVNGRTDEPNTLSNDLGPRGDLPGRFNSNFLNNQITDRDIVDQYRLSIDGGGMQIMPVTRTLSSTDMDVVDPTGSGGYLFLPVQFKPWQIYSNAVNGKLGYFGVVKEDGTEYKYGPLYSESIKVKNNKPVSDNEYQACEFPYRWNLTSITYPDGSSTQIEYQYKNPPSDGNWYYRRYESVSMERSKVLSDITGNFLGIFPNRLVPSRIMYYIHMHIPPNYLRIHIIWFLKLHQKLLLTVLTALTEIAGLIL